MAAINARFAQGALLVLTAVVLWGAQFPIAKTALATLDPFHMSVIRYGVGTTILILVSAWSEGRESLSYRGLFWPAALFGMLGMCGSPLLTFIGLARTLPENVAVIVALQPSMTAVADWLIRGRRPANFTVGCMLVAFAGTIAVVTKGSLSLHPGKGELFGDLLVFAGATCWIAYTMATENFKGWSALRLTTLTLIPGTIGIFVVTAAMVAAGRLTVPEPAALASVGWHLAYLTLAGIVISMLCWTAGNQRIGALNSMLFLNLTPVVTFGIRYAQGHRFLAIELAGAALVVGALMANNLYLRRRHLQEVRSAIRP